MAGDKLNIFGKSYYNNSTNSNLSNSSTPIIDLLTGLLGSPGAAGATAVHGIVTASLINTSEGTAGITTMLQNQNTQSTTYPTIPGAYINYIFFDEQFKYAGGGFSRVGANGEVKDHYAVGSTFHDIAVPKNGFVYIYCSNQSPIDVYFDNLQVVHTRGPILEETNYYPFGLTMAGISSKASGSLENKILYGSKELQSKEFSDDASGLEMYDFGARDYDAQIGLFRQPDPLADIYFEWSPYNYVGNNPLKYIDPTGAEWDAASQSEVTRVLTETSTEISSLNNQIADINKAATDKDGKINLTKEQKEKIDELKFRVGDLKDALTEIQEMANNCDYVFSLSPQTGRYAEMPDPPVDNLKKITINFLAGDVSNELHEIKHGYQIMKGDVIYSIIDGQVNSNLGNGFTSNMSLEVPAWQRQYAFAGGKDGYQNSPPGSFEAITNDKFKLTGTDSQINKKYIITNHTQITATFVKSTQQYAVGNKPFYP